MARKKSAKKPLDKASMKRTKGGHGGGIHVALADGSVRFLSDGVKLPAVQKLT